MSPDDAAAWPWVAAAALLAAVAAPAGAGAPVRSWHALPVAGGPAAVADAAEIDASLPAWRVLHEAARRRHGIWGEEARMPWERDPSAAPSTSGSVPLPLPPATWWELVGGRRGRPDDTLAFVILADRRSALLYRGLAGLDDETLAALAAEPSVLREIRRRHADVLAAFGERFRVRAGAVRLPGGEEAAPLWEGLVGESARRPARFLLRLVAWGDGEHALLFDSVSRLDVDHQRFALGLGLPEAVRPARFRELAAVFEGERGWWRRVGGSFSRPEVDAARLLRVVRVERGGALAPPAGTAFWDGVFEPEGGAEPAARGTVDAAWLARQVAAAPAAERRARLEQLAFAQRTFGGLPSEDGPAVAAVRALRDARALVLSLERMGVRDPGVFAAAAAAARRIGPADTEAARSTHGVFQGALAILDRARFSRTLGASEAEALSRSLFAVVAAGGTSGESLAPWVEGTLLPALASALYGDLPAGGEDTTVLRAMAGDRVGARAALAAVEWEGLAFRADPGRAELRRLERVRERQGGESLHTALLACRSAPSVERAPPCGHRLGRTLVSLVYAAHLGDPEGPALAGEDPSGRHDLGPDPWALAEEVVGPGVPWHVRGSLLGLEVALARLSLHRLAGDAMPDRPPRLDTAHARSLAVAVALRNPRALVDADRSAIAGAVERGRSRVAALRAARQAADAVARDAGLEPWRGQALRWLLEHEPQALSSFFSLGELRCLGGPAVDPSAWGAVSLDEAGLVPRAPPCAGALDPRGRPPQPALAETFDDLALRVALHLEERGLAAVLAREVEAALLPDLLADAPAVAPDDRLGLEAWVRGLTPERLDDAVASLPGRGALQPEEAGQMR